MTIPALVAEAPGSPRQIRAEDLMGRLVRDSEGERVGRIMEMRAEWNGHDCVVLEFHLGVHAAFERLGGGPFWSSLIGLCGGGRAPRVVPWQLMDLRDVRHPRLTCRKGELPETGVTTG